MSTGAPDWQGLRWKTETISRPNYIYPSGKIIFVDGFEEPTSKWETSGAGSPTIEIRTAYPFNGTGALYLYPSTQVNHSAIINRGFGLTITKKIGLQYSFVPNSSTGLNLETKIYRYTGSQLIEAEIKHIMTAGNLVYVDSAGNEQTFSTKTTRVHGTKTRYSSVKFVVDFDNLKYSTFALNDKIHDLREFSLKTSDSTNHPMTFIQIKVLITSAGARTVYLDDVILTEE